MSYYCRIYVIEALVKARKDPGYDTGCDSVMIDLLNLCERDKSVLGSQLEVCVSLV